MAFDVSNAGSQDLELRPSRRLALCRVQPPSGVPTLSTNRRPPLIYTILFSASCNTPRLTPGRPRDERVWTTRLTPGLADGSRKTNMLTMASRGVGRNA